MTDIDFDALEHEQPETPDLEGLADEAAPADDPGPGPEDDNPILTEEA